MVYTYYYYLHNGLGSTMALMGERYYDPGVGRFTQLGSLGDGYAYTGDNPVNYDDVSGLKKHKAKQKKTKPSKPSTGAQPKLVPGPTPVPKPTPTPTPTATPSRSSPSESGGCDSTDYFLITGDLTVGLIGAASAETGVGLGLALTGGSLGATELAKCLAHP